MGGGGRAGQGVKLQPPPPTTKRNAKAGSSKARQGRRQQQGAEPGGERVRRCIIQRPTETTNGKLGTAPTTEHRIHRKLG